MSAAAYTPGRMSKRPALWHGLRHGRRNTHAHMCARRGSGACQPSAWGARTLRTHDASDGRARAGTTLHNRCSTRRTGARLVGVLQRGGRPRHLIVDPEGQPRHIHKPGLAQPLLRRCPWARELPMNLHCARGQHARQRQGLSWASCTCAGAPPGLRPGVGQARVQLASAPARGALQAHLGVWCGALHVVTPLCTQWQHSDPESPLMLP